MLRSAFPHPLIPIHRAGGFTLIEMMMAMLILGLILSVAYGGLSGIMQTTTLIQDGRDGRAVTNAVLMRFTRELQLAIDDQAVMPPRDNVDSPYPGAPRLMGTKESLDNGRRGDSITFVASEAGQYVMDGPTHSGLVQITYRVAKDPEQRNSDGGPYFLIRDETPYKRPFDKAYTKTMTFPITGKLTHLEFRYFDAENNEWRDDWGEEGHTQLPNAVQFTVCLLYTSPSPRD